MVARSSNAAALAFPTHGNEKGINDHNTELRLRYLEEVRIPLHRAGFGTLPLEGAQLPVLWNGAPLCRITGKGSVYYRREDKLMVQEDALVKANAVLQ